MEKVFCVKLQVLVHSTHIYTLSMLFTVRSFLADSLCFIHRRASVWDVPEMDQSTGLEGSYTRTPNLLALELNPSLSLLIFLTYKKLRHCGNCQAISDPHMENSPSATQWHWLEPFQISTVYLSKLPVIKYGDYSGMAMWDPEQIYCISRYIKNVIFVFMMVWKTYTIFKSLHLIAPKM